MTGEAVRTAGGRRWTLLDLLAAVGGAINLVIVGWIFVHVLLN